MSVARLKSLLSANCLYVCTAETLPPCTPIDRHWCFIQMCPFEMLLTLDKNNRTTRVTACSTRVQHSDDWPCGRSETTKWHVSSHLSPYCLTTYYINLCHTHTHTHTHTQTHGSELFIPASLHQQSLLLTTVCMHFWRQLVLRWTINVERRIWLHSMPTQEKR